MTATAQTFPQMFALKLAVAMSNTRRDTEGKKIFEGYLVQRLATLDVDA
ncbi:MAG: hypothetical protein AAF358_08685 [Pseudomonadota bacterium]